MATHDGFLAAIREHPDDDAPRLIYADWLDEHGEPERAEFIRLQIAAAELPEDDPRACDLNIRAEEILAEHETNWLGEWSQRLVRWTFWRGFLDSVTVEAEQFLRYGKALFQEFPVEGITFVGRDGGAVESIFPAILLWNPVLEQVRSLQIAAHSPPPTVWANELATLPAFSGLRELFLSDEGHLGEPPFGQMLLSRILQSRTCANLEVLDFTSISVPGMGDSVVGALTDAVFAPHLKSLSLAGQGIGDTGAAILASDSQFRGLESLHLAGCPDMTPEGVQALLHSSVLTRIRQLWLGPSVNPRLIATAPIAHRLESLDLWPSVERNSWSEASWHIFGSSPQLQRLGHFSIANSPIGPEGVQFLSAEGSLPALRSFAAWNQEGDGDAIIAALADRPHPERFTSLALVNTGVSMRGIHTLASSPLLSGLSKLRISWDPLPTASLQELLESSHLSRRLTSLDLAGWNLRGGGWQMLASCPRLANLTYLNVSNAGIDAEGMAALLASPYLRKLTALHLGGERSSEALRLLASSSGLPRLREVVVDTGADTDTVAAMRLRFGPRLIQLQ